MSDARYTELVEACRELLGILDSTDTNSKGETYHPNTVNSTRVLDATRMDELFTEIRNHTETNGE